MPAKSPPSRPSPSPPPKLLSVPEAAQLLGVSARTTWRLVSNRRLKTVRVGRCLRVVAISIDEFIAKGGA